MHGLLGVAVPTVARLLPRTLRQPRTLAVEDLQQLVLVGDAPRRSHHTKIVKISPVCELSHNAHTAPAVPFCAG